MPSNIPFTDIDAKLLLELADDAANEDFLLLELYCRVLLNNAKNVIKLNA